MVINLSGEPVGQLKQRLEEDSEVKLRMADLKRQLGYIEKTNWFFERETVDFGAFVPFEQDVQYAGAAKSNQQQSFTIGSNSYHHKK